MNNRGLYYPEHLKAFKKISNYPEKKSTLLKPSEPLIIEKLTEEQIKETRIKNTVSALTPILKAQAESKENEKTLFKSTSPDFPDAGIVDRDPKKIILHNADIEEKKPLLKCLSERECIFLGFTILGGFVGFLLGGSVLGMALAAKLILIMAGMIIGCLSAVLYCCFYKNQQHSPAFFRNNSLQFATSYLETNFFENNLDFLPEPSSYESISTSP